MLRRLLRNQNQEAVGSRGASNAQVAEALLDSYGHVGMAASKLGCSKVHVWNRIRESPPLKLSFDQLAICKEQGVPLERAKELAMNAAKNGRLR